MDEVALVPCLPAQNGPNDTLDGLAEQTFNRKKVLGLELGISKLQKTARQQHEVVAQLENDVKTMISETDLQRAIGLTFQEFENRLAETFQDSNKRCLDMFSKRDEVAELQERLDKKVNWKDHNAALSKLAELRQYMDTMANSIFIGHLEALNGEFAKKADRATVEEALRLKADVVEVNEVRSRLEQLESRVTALDKKHCEMVEQLRVETAEKARVQSEKELALTAENTHAIKVLRGELAATAKKLARDEEDIKALKASGQKLKEAQQDMQNHQDSVITPTLESMQDHLLRMDQEAERTRSDLETLASDTTAHKESSQQKFADLTAQAATCREQLEFLMQATEMIKRRARETTKDHTSKNQERADEHSTLREQVLALEQQLKRQEREVKRMAKASDEAGRTLHPAEMAPPDPNQRLLGVLDQLSAIADPPVDQRALTYDPLRPPLPWGGGDGPFSARRSAEVDLGQLQRMAAGNAQVPIDATRANARGIYDMSPRATVGGVVKGLKKKR